MSKKLLSAIARHLRAFALFVALPLFAAAATPPPEVVASPEASGGDAAPDLAASADATSVSGIEAPEIDSDGDLIPDVRDPSPLVANVPVYWSVQKFALSRPSEAGRSSSGQTSWAGAPSLDVATVLPAPKVQASLTAMPLASRKPAAQMKAHPFAPLAVFGADAIRLGTVERARAAAFLRGWRAEGASQPVTLCFTVRFVDLDSKSWTFPGLEVPVVLGGKIWAMARPRSKDPSQSQTGLLLPGDGQVRAVDFLAEIDARSAGAFLSVLALSDFTPSFDFPQAIGLDSEVAPDAPPQPGVYSLSSAFQSILLKTRQIRVEGPGGLVWTWRVAPFDLLSGASVTFGQWAEGMNAVAREVYGSPLFVFDGTYPVSIAGWDNGCWDLYWSASRKGREIHPGEIASQRLNADMALALSATPPSALPAEGATPIVTHLRGVWYHNHGDEEKAIECFSAAGNAGAPQGFSWCGRCKAGMPDIPGGGSGAEPPSAAGGFVPAASPSVDGRTGFGQTGQNKAEAARLYKLAADAGYAPGLAWYGRALAHGEGIAANKEAGAASLGKAADQGFAEGRFLYALFLRKGVGVKPDPAEALELLTQAAWQGCRPAMAALGDLLLESGSLEGRDWIELAANGGDDKAAARLARFLREGEFGTAPDPAAAAKWLQRAADAGDAPSLVSLGEALRAGAGVRRNPKKAAEYFRRAADAGNGDGLTWYAICLLEGGGVRRDVPKALDLLARAADGGNANAKFLLGACLFGGYGGTEPDKPAAMVRFMSAAAEQPAASVFLGVGYLNGLGVAKNPKKAVECFKSAADRDCRQALLWLAYCHANGIGVEKNLEEARKWARKAVDLGVQGGRQMLLSIQE